MAPLVKKDSSRGVVSKWVIFGFGDVKRGFGMCHFKEEQAWVNFSSDQQNLKKKIIIKPIFHFDIFSHCN